MAAYDPNQMSNWLAKTLATPAYQRGNQPSRDIPPSATTFTSAPPLISSSGVGQPSPNQFSQSADAEGERNAKRAAMEKARQDEQKRKEDEENAKREAEAKRQKDMEMARTIKAGERADMALANKITSNVFGGAPDKTANPNARRVSPPSAQQRSYEMTRNILYREAQERRRGL